MKAKLNVLIPLDFSEVSFKALAYAEILGESIDLNLHLVHVVEVSDSALIDGCLNAEAVDMTQIKLSETRAHESFAELKQNWPKEFNAHVLTGPLTSTLLRFTEEEQIQLAMLGTEGATGWFEKVSGSEAQYLVRHMSVPVITVHEYAHLSGIRNILWVGDFSPKEKVDAALPLVHLLQDAFGARIHLLHILKEGEKTETYQQLAEAFIERHQLRNTEIHFHQDSEVVHGVKTFNQESSMDLVFIGTHGRKGISHLFFGSVAEKLVNRCIKPLLTYHLN